MQQLRRMITELIYLASDKTRRGSTNSAVGAGTDSNNVRVDGTWDTVLRLRIQLRESVPIVDTGFLNISNGSLLHYVPHYEPLYGLVLWATFATVGASDWVDMATVVLVPPSVPTLESLGADSLNSLSIWGASSLVGAKTKQREFLARPCLALNLMILSMMGIPKARVFPVTESWRVSRYP